MKKIHLIRYISALLSLMMLLSLFSCNTDDLENPTETEALSEESLPETNDSTLDETDIIGETESHIDTNAVSETDTETHVETNTDLETASETETKTDTETETEADTEPQGPSEPECEKCSFKTVKGLPTCKVCGFIALCRGEHGYASDENGHWKPECEHCGKAAGKTQNHEYVEKIDDAGNAWAYVFRCSICKYVAYEQLVSYKITSFFSAAELSGIDTNKTFSGEFRFDMGTGFAAYTLSSAGSGTVKISSGEEVDMESGRYLVMKLRLPASQSGFTATIRSACAQKSYTMAFNDLRPGWITLIVDMTKAVSIGKDGSTAGYQIDANGEYYLYDLSINSSLQSGESLDIAYVMICDTIEEANSFTATEKQLYLYEDIVNDEPKFIKLPCTDKDGNEIVHTFESDENGHTVTEACYQCGLRQTSNEPHTFTQMRVNGELTYACSICEYLQYGYALNKYFSAADIHNNALVYYKIDKNTLTENDIEFTRFSGQNTTAQVIFARHNSSTVSSTMQSAADQMAAAFSVGKGTLLVVRMRTNNPDVNFAMWLGGMPLKESKVFFPTKLATVVSEPDADTVEYGWTTYVIDLPRAIPNEYLPDENGEYKLHNFYFQMEKGDAGVEFSSDVYFDLDYVAVVDSWDEVKKLVVDDTVVKVNTSNIGTIVKTQEQECVGEHSWGENVGENTYSYLCVNCGKPIKTVTVPTSVQKYVSGFEVARNAVVYALPGTREVLVDEDNTVSGRVNGCGEIWWIRDQKDYMHGVTGAKLEGKKIDVGNSKYLVARLRTDDNTKNFEFYISTTGKSGTPRTEAEVEEKKPIEVPTTNGMVLLYTPLNASTVGEWTTYVFDLEKLIPEYYVKDEETGHYILDSFGIYFSKEYNVDVDYIAFIEGDWSEIPNMTSDKTVIYATHYSNKTFSIMDTVTGKCADEHSYIYTGELQNDGSTTYTYACGGCGDLLYSKNVPSSVAHFISGDNVAYGASMYLSGGTTSAGVGDDGVFYGRIANHGQILWMRHEHDFAGKTDARLNNKFFDVGNAQYFVLRMKTSDPSKYVQFSLSTTGKNGEGYSKAPDGTVTPPTTSGYATLAAPVEKTAAAGEWITYVFDLEEIFSDYYVKDEETGHYIIDTFLITYARECNVDIEFMAFVDGDFADISKLTSDDSVIYVTHAAQKTYVVKDADTGENIVIQ